ncbi:MAG: aromatic-ring-hydroxylating dioxygenase subunit beta [Pseudomonadales bacterium]|nr:aromatic-ring-hydroxylating dioxygenase subunit beta [Pseudomonadales bacterium]MBL4868922.1 aromatic-ring-hydroxylating dioxygenase subunit beta [Pseudomonadales bacterium]
MSTNKQLDLKERVESFLFKEARLMDSNSYQPWLDLWDKKCIYWIPCNNEDTDPKKHVSILYCDRRMLENHIIRLIEGNAFAQSPKSRTLRTVTNIETYQDGDTIKAYANFMVVELRGHVQNMHAGRSEYELLESDSDFIIQKKKVILLKLDEAQDNVTFLL